MKNTTEELVENYIKWFYNESSDELYFLIETILSSDKRQIMLDVMTDLINEQEENE